MKKLFAKCDKSVFNVLLFKSVFLAVTLAIASPFVHLILGDYVKVLLIWGFLIIVYQLFRQRSKFKNPYLILLVLFAGLYGITILLNRQLNFSANLKALMYMVLIFVVIYGYGKERDKDTALREIKVLIITFLCVAFCMALASFITYMFSIKGHVVYNEQWVYYGMFENRLWGIYNPSTGSAINTISILLSLGYWFYEASRKWEKILLAVNIFIHYICLILTNSRTALYTLIFGAGLILFLWIIYIRKEDKKPEFKTVLKSVVVSAAACIILVLSVSPVKEAFSYLPGVVSNMRKDDSTIKKSDKKKIEKEQLTRLEELENRPGGILTGRTELWEAGIKTFTEAPLFGITRENIPDRVGKNLDDNYWMRDLQRGGVHNIYLTVLISSGAAGFIPFMIFIVLLIIAILKTFYKCVISKENGIYLCIAVVLSIQLIMECLEGRILYQVGGFYSLFWCLAGYVTYFIEKDKVNKNSKSIENLGK